jgi:SAM-dependent methyltransferase
MRTFTQILDDTFHENELQKAVLSRPLPKSRLAFSKVTVRPVNVKGRACFQFTYRQDNKEVHENLDRDAARTRIADWCETAFSDCNIFTRVETYSIRFRPDGKARIRRKAIEKPAVVETAHNRAKPYLIPEGKPCAFLIEMGVMTGSGTVRPARYHKFKQVNRFLELVNDVVPSLPASECLNIIDFGCGKSYLTFALHYLLTEIHGREVRIIGLDRRADVIAQCSALTAKLNLSGLSFRKQEIAKLPKLESGAQLDLVVALHACDTATDDAIAQAIRRQAGIILAVPCCQHEVAQAMTGDALQGIARHGILKERFAAIATDAIRAEILEEQGYQTQVVEFIDLEHTAKNVLIRAVKRAPEHAPVDRTREIAQLKAALGISSIHLETALAG